VSEKLLKKIVQPEDYGLTVMNSDRIVSLRDTTLRNTQKSVIGRVIPNEAVCESDELVSLDELVRGWFLENINIAKDINVPELVIDVLKAFPDHSPMVVAQEVIFIAQESKRPARGSDEVKWVSVPGLGHVRSNRLERNVK
jgi:hypothetical protein